jgi:uncharacterized membrane protein
MAANTRDSSAGSKTGDGSSAESLASQLGLSRLGEQLQGLASAMADRGVSVVTERLDGLTDKMSGSTGKAVKNMAKGDSAPKAALKAGIETVKDSGLKGASTIKDKVSEAVGGDNGGDKGKDKMKFINIVEELDLPVPRAVAYRAWTQFEEFPSFMKKVENVEQQEHQTVEWKAQIFWFHRSWTAEIVDQVPNQRIVWRSKGEKGYVDGAVTFHELTPDLTRMLVNLEYYPQGFVERTGNLWRAQGRRARLELKFFRRYITSEVLLRQGEVEGWSGEIHDGEVTEEASDSKDQGSERSEVTEEASDSKDQVSERSESAPAAKSSPKKPAPTATTSSRPRPAAKKSTSSESSPSRPRPAAKKSSSNESSPSRPRPAAKKSSSNESSPSRPRPAAKKSSSSASSSRGTTAKKSTTSSSRSRS